MRLLESLEWGKPALALLNHCRDLNVGRPALMHIRHTERVPVDTVARGDDMLSTPRGLSAAAEFGARLSSSRRIRLHHTVVTRAKETAKAILDGVTSSGGSAEIVEVIPYRYSIERETVNNHLNRILDTSATEAEAAVRFTNDWIDGKVSPPSCILPSEEFAEMARVNAVKSLESAAPKVLDLYVSHDTYVGCLMHHWFGVPVHAVSVSFLDGFLIQPEEESLTVWFRETKNVINYPLWWRPLYPGKS